jgi:hypothetical protein
MKTFRQLTEGFGPECPEQVEDVTTQEASTFVNTYRTAMRKLFGVEFEFSNHFVRDRLNDPRNKPLISICEVQFVLNGFLKKYQGQLKTDIEAVKNGTVKPRGKNKERLKPGELEFVISSRSTFINIAFVLKQDHGRRGTAVILPITLIRKPAFQNNKGVQVFIEGKEYDRENVYYVD